MELNASEESYKNKDQVRNQRKNDKFELDSEVKVISATLDNWSKLLVIETSCCSHDQYSDIENQRITLALLLVYMRMARRTKPQMLLPADLINRCIRHAQGPIA